MRYMTLLKANMRQQKKSLLGICILMFTISISVCAVLTISNNATTYEHEQLQRLKYGDITFWVADVPEEINLQEQLSKVDGVARVESQSALYTHFSIHGIVHDETGILLSYEPEHYDYHIFQPSLTGFYEETPSLAKDEVFLPVVFQSEFHADVGDILLMDVLDGVQQPYKIKGFFEDPVMGSSLMGVKSVLLHPQAQEELITLLEKGEDLNLRKGSVLHTFQSDENTQTIGAFQSQLNEQTDVKNYTLFAYSKDTIASFMLIMQTIMTGFLLLMVGILFIITMVIMGHSIANSIEQGYVDIGILKAIGYTSIKLRSMLILQYSIAIGGSMLCGLWASSWVVHTINAITLTTTGILIPSTFPRFLGFTFLGSTLCLLICFIYFKTMRIVRVEPMRAIHGGLASIHFHSHLHVSIRKPCLSFWLALRQLTTGKKQYIGTLLTALLLVFILSLSVRIGAWMGPNGEGISDSFAAATSDFGVYVEDKEQLEQIEQQIETISPIAHTYTFINVKGTIHDVNAIMNIISDPSYYHILQGRTCVYANEVVLTEVLAQSLGVGIGDMVSISYQGNSSSFIISGINQCANDMGSNFSISQAGFERLSSTLPAMETCYQLQHPQAKKEVVQLIKETFPDIEVDENIWSGLTNALTAMKALEVLIYAFVLLFILVVIALTSSKLLHQEKQTIGIYKAVGFSAQQLRVSFALRFGIAAAVGSSLGTLCSVTYADAMTSAFLRMMGISQFIAHPSFMQILLPGGVVSVLCMLFAYVEARFIKHIDPLLLISE